MSIISMFLNNIKKEILPSILALMLLAFMLPFAVSCGDGSDGWVVQVWQPSSEGQPEELLAYGAAVEDGSHVLTVLDYEEYTPGELLVVSPEYGQFAASIQAIDYRTSATLLRLQDANLPVAETGSILPAGTEQEALICGWNSEGYVKNRINATFLEELYPLFFTTSLSNGIDGIQEEGGLGAGEGSPVIDGEGRLIGLLGGSWSKLVVRLGFPGDLPPAVSIEGAMALLSDTSRNEGPAAVVVADDNNATDSLSRLPISTLENIDTVIMDLLDELGEPLPLEDMSAFKLREDSFSLMIGIGCEDGVMLAAAFTYPVELYKSDGSLPAEVKWVGIQWKRDEGKPNRLFYGSVPYAVEGAYGIEGDISELEQLLQPVLQKLSD